MSTLQTAARLFQLSLPVLVATSTLMSAGIRIEPLVTGLSSPLYVTHAGDSSGRLFIVERGGHIRIWNGVEILGAPFLDISSRVIAAGERGLLGLAFHPAYASNGRFFVNYTRLEMGQLQTVVAEYQVNAGDPNLASPDEQILLTFDQPANNHNGGWMAFGPDGYLYISTGDGGGGGDPYGNGQNINTVLGAILRIDVNSGGPYAIPPDNPFVAAPGADEIYAYGLRNPWRGSFDRGSGRLFLGDVGQNSFEEVDIIVKGGNYGWNILEGNSCYPPGSSCDTTGLVPPIATYGRSEGASVTGGYVYRGPEPNEYVGSYIFGDFVSGRIWSLKEQSPNNWVRTLELTTATGALASFGEDQDGNLFVVHLTGSVYAVRFGEPPPRADLKVTLELESADLVVGKTVTFVATVENLGPQAAPNVTVRDALPQSLQFQGASPSTGSCTPASNLVVCNLGTLEPNQVASIELLARLGKAGNVLNIVTVESGAEDPISANDSDSVSFQVQPPPTDLAISKMVDEAAPQVDSIVSFEIRVSNIGPSQAGDLLLADSLPEGMSLESFFSADFDCQSEDRTVTCTAASLGPGAEASVTIMARILTSGDLRNEATISFDGQDSNPGNNLAGVDVTASFPPDLGLEKNLQSGLFPGKKGEYLLRVTNLGGLPSDPHIRVEDELPEPLLFFSAEAPDWNCEAVGNLVTCLHEAPLEPSESSEIRIRVLVGEGAGEVSNSATVSVSGDANSVNDTATSVEPLLSLDELPLTYAQLAIGGGFELVLLVSNRGELPWQGTAQLRQGNDLPWNTPWILDAEEQSDVSEFAVDLAPRSSQRLVLGGDETARSGFLRFVPKPGSSSLQLLISFFYQLSEDGTLNDSTATAPAIPGKQFEFPVERRGTSTDTGFAWAPLEAADPFPVVLRLYDASGEMVSSQLREFTGHEELLLEEVFSDLPENFIGLLIIESPRLIHLTVLRLDAGGTLQLTNITPRIEPH